MRAIQFHQLTLGSFARIGALCNACLWMPLGFVAGIAALFGATTITLNGAYVVGLSGLFGGLFLGLVFTLIGTAALVVGAAVSRLIPGLLANQFLQVRS